MSTAHTILVADDDDLNREVMEAFLTAEEYPVLLAHDGRQALAMAEQQRPALILLDVKMPYMDGYEVCRELRQRPATAAIPIIILTGYDTAKDRAEGLAAGANAFLVRPFAVSELLALVSSLIEG